MLSPFPNIQILLPSNLNLRWRGYWSEKMNEGAVVDWQLSNKEFMSIGLCCMQYVCQFSFFFVEWSLAIIKNSFIYFQIFKDLFEFIYLFYFLVYLIFLFMLLYLIIVSNYNLWRNFSLPLHYSRANKKYSFPYSARNHREQNFLFWFIIILFHFITRRSATS